MHWQMLAFRHPCQVQPLVQQQLPCLCVVHRQTSDMQLQQFEQAQLLQKGVLVLLAGLCHLRELPVCWLVRHY